MNDYKGLTIHDGKGDGELGTLCISAWRKGTSVSLHQCFCLQSAPINHVDLLLPIIQKFSKDTGLVIEHSGAEVGEYSLEVDMTYPPPWSDEMLDLLLGGLFAKILLAIEGWYAREHQKEHGE